MGQSNSELHTDTVGSVTLWHIRVTIVAMVGQKMRSIYIFKLHVSVVCISVIRSLANCSEFLSILNQIWMFSTELYSSFLNEILNSSDRGSRNDTCEWTVI